MTTKQAQRTDRFTNAFGLIQQATQAVEILRGAPANDNVVKALDMLSAAHRALNAAERSMAVADGLAVAVSGEAACASARQLAEEATR